MKINQLFDIKSSDDNNSNYNNCIVKYKSYNNYLYINCVKLFNKYK